MLTWMQWQSLWIRSVKLFERILEFAQLGKCCTLKEFQSLGGYINWSLAVFPLLKPALSALYAKIAGKTKSKLPVWVNNAICLELQWFVPDCPTCFNLRWHLSTEIRGLGPCIRPHWCHHLLCWCINGGYGILVPWASARVSMPCPPLTVCANFLLGICCCCMCHDQPNNSPLIMLCCLYRQPKHCWHLAFTEGICTIQHHPHPRNWLAYPKQNWCPCPLRAQHQKYCVLILSLNLTTLLPYNLCLVSDLVFLKPLVHCWTHLKNDLHHWIVQATSTISLVQYK